LSAITSELQNSVLKTRMQPIEAAWKTLPRLVRDIANNLGKKINLVLEGEATELDRQVLELIKDPLLHMVRNAAGHGLETPAERLAAGKPEVGTLRLSASHEAGAIIVRIADDGRGLDTAAIRRKAAERGLVSQAEAELMPDAQAHQLIFAPGFSTAHAVTNLSGRGVGLDVARSNIEQISGQIDLTSTPGQGTAFTIKIPLTLAIIPALIVATAGRRFAVPQASVIELVRIGPRSAYPVESIESVRVLRLRDCLLPLVGLARGLALAEEDESAGFVLVMQAGGRRFGVIVEAVLDIEETVVKPLARILRCIPVFSGATILGDGSVVLIVDPNGLAQLADCDSSETDNAEAPAAAGSGAEVETPLLLVRAGGGALKVVELSRITRLERVLASELEQAGSRTMLQYRGRLMPVLAPEGAAAVAPAGRRQSLLILATLGHPIALAVDEIVDAVEDRLDIQMSPDRPGVLGTAVVAGQAVEVMDMDWYLLKGMAEYGPRLAEPEPLKAVA
jgi:two-component system chemotaxis sensor kinase CheA